MFDVACGRCGRESSTSGLGVLSVPDSLAARILGEHDVTQSRVEAIIASRGT